MRKFTLLFTVILALNLFSNNAYCEAKSQNFAIGLFSFIQQLFSVENTVPAKTTDAVNLNLQPTSWLQLFLGENWLKATEPEVLTNTPQTSATSASKGEANVVLSQKETTQTIVTSTSTTTITRTSKITTQPEAIDISEMMILLEEVGAGSAY